MKKFGDLLVEQKLISPAQLKQALEIQQEDSSKRLGRILLEKGWVSQQELIHFLGKQLEIPYVELSNYEIDPEIVSKISKEFMLRYQMVPLREDEGNIVVAMADPLDVIAQDEAALATKKKVVPVLAKADDIERVVQSYFGEEPAADLVSIFPFADPILVDRKRKEQEIAEGLILQAYRFRATELNVEPRVRDVRVRYRIDGVPYDFPPILKEKQEKLIRTLKGYLNLEEKELPQVGRFFGIIQQHRVNMRGFTMPTLFGERVSLRFLNLPSSFVSLDRLGMIEEVRKGVGKMLQSPYGLFLIAAPGDSGRSTTYYAFLKEFEKARKVVFSFEDPVEHVIPNVHQVQLKLEAGFDYRSALESTLRQLPDVVLISRIAEAEVARFANQLALSGRLVVGVVHAHDTAMGIEKMLDFGIEPHLLASTLLGVLSPRLLRVLCKHCCKKEEGKETNRAVGCSKCMYTGYRSRRPIFEVLKVKEALAEKIGERLSAPALRMLAENAGMASLSHQAKSLVANGITSEAEVRRVMRID